MYFRVVKNIKNFDDKRTFLNYLFFLNFIILDQKIICDINNINNIWGTFLKDRGENKRKYKNVDRDFLLNYRELKFKLLMMKQSKDK